MKRWGWWGMFLIVGFPGLATGEHVFDIHPVVEGVYAAIPKFPFHHGRREHSKSVPVVSGMTE